MDFIVRKVTVICTTAVSQDVSVDRWPADKLIRWTQITGVGRSGPATTIEVGLKRSREFYCFRGAVPAAANCSVDMPGLVTASGEFRPTARFKGATVGDTLELNCAGVIED